MMSSALKVDLPIHRSNGLTRRASIQSLSLPPPEPPLPPPEPRETTGIQPPASADSTVFRERGCSVDESAAKVVADEKGNTENTPKILHDYPNLIQSIAQFYNQTALSDVVLKVGVDVYSAHKFVLAKSSDVFRTMLYGQQWMKQGNQEVVLSESIECQAVFDRFLRYLYTAEVAICTDTAVGILCLADKYNVTSLKELCTQYMIEHSKSPRVTNALQWYPWSKALHLTTLFERCFECICWNLYDIITSDDWLVMDLEFVEDVLKTSHIVIPDEFTLFECVVNWLMHSSRIDSLYDNCCSLLPLIRFPQMMVGQLTKLEHHDISKNVECADLMKELIGKAYRFRAVCPSQNELGLSFREVYYQPRDYCYQIVDTVRMANSLRFGVQVDVKMFVGPVPREDRNGDWKITYRKNGDVWSLQINCHESAMTQSEARFQATVLVSNDDEKVIQVQRAQEFVCTRGNHQNVQVNIEDPRSAKIMATIIKPVVKGGTTAKF